jgi:hypothetical protein
MPKSRHAEIRWNAFTYEWFCMRCGVSSGRLAEADARAEVERSDCVLLPSVNLRPEGESDEEMSSYSPSWVRRR